MEKLDKDESITGIIIMALIYVGGIATIMGVWVYVLIARGLLEWR